MFLELCGVWGKERCYFDGFSCGSGFRRYFERKYFYKTYHFSGRRRQIYHLIPCPPQLHREILKDASGMG